MEAIVTAAREREERQNRFTAALKGINLDNHGGEETVADKVERMKQEAEAKRRGISVDKMEFEDLGLDFEEG